MDNAVILPPNEDTAEEAQLRAALQQSDNEVATEQATEAEPKPPTEKAEKSESPTDEVAKTEKPDSSEPEAERTDGRDEKGRFTAKVEKEPVKPLTEGQPEAEQPAAEPVAKPDKDAERTARAWQKIQAEKLEVRNALAEVRQLKAQLQQQAQAPQAPQARFSSKDYSQAADEFERQAATLMKEGDVEQASQKLDLARQSRMAAQQYGQQEQAEAQRTQSSNLEREWASHTEAAIKEFPALGDPSTVEAQAMMELLEDYPILGYIPDGFRKGVEILQMRRDAATASGLRADNEKLKKEIKELREKTAISGGGVVPKVNPTDFDSMTLEQQEAFLVRQARQEDFARTS